MVKFHSTISRRDFLKILGLGGAGFAAAVSAPAFHDLDEVLTSPEAEFKRPCVHEEQIPRPPCRGVGNVN